MCCLPHGGDTVELRATQHRILTHTKPREIHRRPSNRRTRGAPQSRWFRNHGRCARCCGCRCRCGRRCRRRCRCRRRRRRRRIRGGMARASRSAWRRDGVRWAGRDGSRRLGLSARGGSECHRDSSRVGRWRCVRARDVGGWRRLRRRWRDRRVRGDGIWRGVCRWVPWRPPIENRRKLPKWRRRARPCTKLRLRLKRGRIVTVLHGSGKLRVTDIVSERCRCRRRRVRRRIRIAFQIRKDNPPRNLKPIARAQ